MGILRSGINGPTRNKIGPSITRIHRNINVITASYRKSNKAPTAGQLNVQEKLGLLSSYFSRIDDLIKIGFKYYAKGKDPVNVASSYNYDHAFLSDGTTLMLNYPELVYSRGYIVPAESAALLALPAQIEFNWLPQRQSTYCQYSDLATFLVYNPTKNMSIRRVAITDRYAQGYVFGIPPTFAGDTVHCYMNFASKDGKLQGNSVYVGELTCI